MQQVPKGAEILEIGAGTGWDAQNLMEEYRLTLTDVSPQTLARLSSKLANTKNIYIAVDGAHLPFIDQSFDGVYMVATLHHLPEAAKGISEFARVLKPNGKLAIAIEPNFTYFYFIKKLRGFFCWLTHMNPADGSHADAEMEGFSYTELKKLFSTGEWENVTIKPVWLFAGYWHYGAEMIYRALRLKKRLALPAFFEWVLIYIDELLFMIPGIKHLCWHWSVYATKSKL
jgi:ubiquinone/menaquinone biosynthesis C-methylase UbiE